MTARHLPALRHALPLLIVIGLVFIPVAGALANDIRYDSVDILPMYARISAGEVFHDDDWGVIVFYRPPACVPSTFNLLDGYDWENAYGCVPMTVDGFIVWEEPWLQPLLMNMHGLGAVPVWFVPWEGLQTELSDGTLTMEELSGLQPEIGSASNYQEVLQPGSEDDFGMIEYNAKGLLENGQSFKVHVLWNSPDNMRVNIDMK